MCGIIAYIGDKAPTNILLQGLRRLEYRGYDSAGIAYLNKKQALCIHKRQGKVDRLVEKLPVRAYEDILPIGVGHTRWATHGNPNDTNAHPHVSDDGKVVLVHNGIIENYFTLRKELKSKAHTFSSQTDTEVLATFIADIWRTE